MATKRTACNFSESVSAAMAFFYAIYYGYRFYERKVVDGEFKWEQMPPICWTRKYDLHSYKAGPIRCFGHNIDPQVDVMEDGDIYTREVRFWVNHRHNNISCPNGGPKIHVMTLELKKEAFYSDDYGSCKDNWRVAKMAYRSEAKEEAEWIVVDIPDEGYPTTHHSRLLSNAEDDKALNEAFLRGKASAAA